MTSPHAFRRCTGLLLLAAVLSIAAGPVATPAAAQTQRLERGDSGRDVRKLQRALGIAADGAYGPATARAVRRFQRAEGLRPTGRADRRTLAALGLSRSSRSSKQTGGGGSGVSDTEEAPAPIRLPRAVLAELQDALGITADGAMGPQTRRAIRRYERRNDMVVDGRPDAVLLADLGIDPDAEADAEPTEPAPEPTGEWAEAIAAAQSAIGTPYASAGTTTAGFDCSGLMVWAFKQAGRRLPRTSFDQYERGTAIDESEIAPGDLVFFDTAGAGASHVGIASSATTVISATTRGVKEHPIDDRYWGSHYIGAKRL